MTNSPELPAWQRAHNEANDQGHDGYIDPTNGLFVMTRGYLERSRYLLLEQVPALSVRRPL